MERILGVRFGSSYDPADTWSAWMGHWCGVQRRDMAELTFGQIVGMSEFANPDRDGG